MKHNPLVHRVGSASKQLLLTALLALSVTVTTAGIPEPDLVWYGKVLTSAGNSTIRLTTGTLVWQVEPLAGGSPIVLTTPLTNINDQFSFALRVPCETPEPGPISSNIVRLTAPPARYRRLTVMLDGQPLAFISGATEFSPLPTDRGLTERLDLRLGTIPVDTDGDGLADAWEMQYFGGLSANPNADPDGDGMSNLREYRAGTNPTDRLSLLELVEISKVSQGVSVRWSSQPARRYRVRRSSTLLAAPSEYLPLQGALAATPPINEFIDTNAVSNGQFFYLIEVED